MRAASPLLLLLIIGCTGHELVGSSPADEADLAQELPDGMVQTGCKLADDCDDGNPCTTDDCGTWTHMCTHKPKSCPDDSCNTSGCDSTTGNCTLTPANEGMMCLTSANPGICTTGSCQVVAQCKSGLEPGLSLDCGANGLDLPKDDTSNYTNELDTYACATDLTGPEVGYPFQVATDRNVTVWISQASVDLDLIVLEGSACVALAKCAAFATTTGNGDESVSFLAKADQPYYIVVDGKAGVKGSFQLNVACEKLCNSTQVLPCNQTIMGDTTGGPSKVNFTDCSTTPTPGPENTWKVPGSPINYTIKLSPLTQDLDMFLLNDYGNDCDGSCKQSNVATGTTPEQIQFQGELSDNSHYQLIIDSKSTGGPYQLEVSCAPLCEGRGRCDCMVPVTTRRSDDPTAATRLFDHWTCAPNETGPEVMHMFAPTHDGQYTFELTGLSEDLDLIVMEMSGGFCDANAACVASSLKIGTADESVTFMASSSKAYYVIVDGKSGAASNYTLRIKSSMCALPNCANPANTLSCNYREETRSSADPAHSVSNVSDWTCDSGTGGPEVVYTFVPTVAGSYTVTLDGIATGQNLDLVVLQDNSTNNSACDSNAMCYAQSVMAGNANESVTFMADPMKTYYIAVDGKGTSSSSYHIKLASTSCGAPACVNGNTSISCTTPIVSGSNDASGATSDVTTWTCTGLPDETGPEFAHKFTPAQSGSYTVQLIGLHADLDLLVLEADATGACAAGGTCVASSHLTGNASESVTFTADVSKTYYIVVDGKAGAISRYELAITDGCP